MNTGFMVVVAGGRIEVRFYGPDPLAGRSLLSHCRDGNLHALLMGRLYYREGAAEADAARVLAVWRHRGLAGIEALEGEFAAIVIDDEAQRVVAIRDPMGGFPLYWLGRPGLFAVASGLRPLVALIGDHTLNLGFLGEIQMQPYAEIDYCEETVFAGVNRLPSGWRLTFDLDGERTESRSYWSWSEHIVDPGPGAVQDIADGFGERLKEAVRQRARGTVAAHLSGGMDSTAVALLARDALAGEGRPVHALALVYHRLIHLRDEGRYLDGPLAQPGIEAHRIVADDILDFDVFADPPLHDEPHHGLFRAGINIATIKAAQAAGADTILTGFGADELVANRPFRIADLLRRGRVFAAWSEAARWGRAQASSSWQFFTVFGLRPILPIALQPGLRAWLAGGFAGWKGQTMSTIPPWVRLDFARAGRLKERARDYLRHNYRGEASILRSEALARLRYTSGDWVRSTLALPHGIMVAHPFRDPRLIGFALGARERVAPRPDRQKILLATAMRHVLPEAILLRRDKVDFNAVYYEGLARNQAMLERLIDQSGTDLFDKPVLLSCLREAVLGFRPLDAMSALNNTLVILEWQSLLPRWLGCQAKPREVIIH